MSTELQRIVDALGAELRRAVAIDDPRFRLQVYSPHYGEVDDTRRDSILHREAPSGSVAWVLSQGVATATDVMRLPPNDELGLLARIISPIRHDGTLLGYIVLIEGPEQLDEEDLSAVRAATDAAALLLHRERLIDELERGRERELLRDLLSEDAAIRADAVAQIHAGGTFEATSPAVALVVRAIGADVTDAEARTALEVSLEHGRRLVSAHHSLQLARGDHGVFLLAVAEPSIAVHGVEWLAARVRDHLAGKLRGAHVVIGVGGQVRDLERASQSYRQARRAARVAEIVGSFGQIVDWDHLGIYRVLAHLPVEELAEEMLHPGLRTLFEADNAETLVRTLECYLDRAGDVKETSAELVIHRTSLYYRLGRIEELAGLSLRDGETRLALHLGLKLARLAGVHPLEVKHV